MSKHAGQTVTMEISARDKTQKALKGVNRNLRKTNKEANSLADRFRNMARATAAIEGPLGGTAGRLSVISTLLGSANVGMVGFSAAMTAMTLITVDAIRRFGQFEEQMFKVTKLLETTGSASGLTANEIAGLADEIAVATLQSRNGVLEASSVLLSFKSIAGDTFRSTMRVASDMSAIMGTDLKSSVVQLGKALEDPARGLSALARSGITFSQVQKDLIIDMQAAGNAAQAQTEILKILEGQLGGAGAAAGGGLSGAIDLVGGSWDKLMVQLGQSGLGDTVTGALKQIGTGMNNVANKLNDQFDTENKLNKLLIRRFELVTDIAKINESSGRAATRRRQALNSELDTITKRADILSLILLNENKAKDIAVKRADITKQALKDEALAVQKAKEADSAKKAAETQLKQDTSAAGKFGEKLANENQQLQDALLTREGLEDLYRDRRLQKIQMNLDEGLIKASEAEQQRLDAFQIHSLKVDAIKEQSADKEIKLNARVSKDEFRNARRTMQTRIQVGNSIVSSLQVIGTKSEKMAKLAFFAEKALAFGTTIMNTQAAAIKARVIDPTGVLSASVLAAGYTAAGIIAATAFSGGSSGASSSSGITGGTSPVTTPTVQPTLDQSLLPQGGGGSVNITINNPELLSSESIGQLVDEIKDQIDNKDVILISSASRNGQEFAA